MPQAPIENPPSPGPLIFPGFHGFFSFPYWLVFLPFQMASIPVHIGCPPSIGISQTGCKSAFFCSQSGKVASKSGEIGCCSAKDAQRLIRQFTVALRLVVGDHGWFVPAFGGRSSLDGEIGKDRLQIVDNGIGQLPTEGIFPFPGFQQRIFRQLLLPAEEIIQRYNNCFAVRGGTGFYPCFADAPRPDGPPPGSG